MPAYSLDPERIKLLSWNIAKGSRHGWELDLASLVHEQDLVLIQEASLERGMHQALGNRSCWAFAPGFSTRRQTTGVMTLSRAITLGFHAHQHPEPLIRLPKAALVTEYRLKGMQERLMVANIHAINFTAGTRSFQRQLERLHEQLRQHDGPLIFAGDFNTWRHKRVRVMESFLQSLGLSSAEYATDQRKQAFGLALDHLFYRGLKPLHANAYKIRSSDHSPVLAELTVVK